MKKQAMIASLMALALLVSPIGSWDSMPQINAEEDSGTAISSGSDNASVSEDSTQKVQLDAPANLQWYDTKVKYRMTWEGVHKSICEDGHIYWGIEVYKDDRIFHNMTFGAFNRDSYWDSETYQWIADTTLPAEYGYSFASYIHESGTYKFRVYACAAPYDMSYQDSGWSEWSDSINYVRPEQELGMISGYWDAEKAGVGHFAPLEESEYVDSYYVTVYKQDESYGSWYMASGGGEIPSQNISSTIVDVDLSNSISEMGEGKYCFTVRALSNDIDVVANGKEGPKSDILDTKVNAEKLSGILSSAADKNAAETVDLLKGSADISVTQQAMQTSDTFREQVKDLEKRYAAEQGIEVKNPIVSDTAREYVDSDKVSVVGAAFNAAQGQEVSLQMDVTPAESRVPAYSAYKKDVQLDIKLVSGNAEIHNLALPVSVTMPIPQGINPSQLVILHYHADGTTERTVFHVNGDGTITFTVSSFSTFVFAEESSVDTPDDTPDSTPGQDTPTPTPGQDTPTPVPSQNVSGNNGSVGRAAAQDNLESQIASAAPGATVKVTKEQNINALSNSIMQMLVKRGDVTLDMEYTYEGADYHVMIPAGGAVDNDIAWYGPLYLSAYFTAANPVVENVENGSVYIVKKGDMLEKIARSYNTTVAQLMAANPQIKNANRITPGQVINIK